MEAVASPPSDLVVLASDGGSTTIQPHVVAKIVGLAVREVPGVAALVPFGTGQTLSNLASAITGGDMRNLGVDVEVGKSEVAADIRIIAEYGESIPAIAQQIRVDVSRLILEMTGLKVTEVNIEITDLDFDESAAIVETTARVQ